MTPAVVPVGGQMKKPTLVFAAETLNLAEVTRMLEIAKASAASFSCVFLSYDGAARNHAIIEAEGFAVRALAPQMNEQDVERFWAVDRGERIDDIFTRETLTVRVRSELALYEELNPVAVITGFCLSVPISARAAKVPLVWISQTTWLPEYARRFAEWPDAFDSWFTRSIPRGVRGYLARRLPKVVLGRLVRPFNQVAKAHGVAPFAGHDLLEGDHTLFAEPPELCPEVQIPERMGDRARYIGALPARLAQPIPETIVNMPRDLPIVYFAMGSSGLDHVVAKIIHGFAAQPYRVIAPVAQLLKRMQVQPPPNVFVTDWLPADKVNAWAAVSVIHGGIGTVMTACAAGTPIVGIPNGNPEQEYNLDCIVRKGFGVRFHKNRLDPQQLLAAIDHYLHDEDAKARARVFQREVLRMDGPAEAARFLIERFGNASTRG